MVQAFVALAVSLRHMKWELASCPSEANSATSASRSGTETETQVPLVPCPALIKLWMPPARPHLPLSSLTYHICEIFSVKLTPQNPPGRAKDGCRESLKVWYLDKSVRRIFKDQPAAEGLKRAWYIPWPLFTFFLILLWFLSPALFSLQYFPPFTFHLCKETRHGINTNSFSKIVALAKRVVFKESWQQNKHGRK